MPRSFLITKKKSRKSSRNERGLKSSPRIPLAENKPSSPSCHDHKTDLPSTKENLVHQGNATLQPPKLPTQNFHKSVLWQPHIGMDPLQSSNTQLQNDQKYAPAPSHTTGYHPNLPYAFLPYALPQQLSKTSEEPQRNPSSTSVETRTFTDSIPMFAQTVDKNRELHLLQNGSTDTINGAEESRTEDTNHPADDSGYRTSSLYSPVSSCDLTDEENKVVNIDNSVHKDSSVESDASYTHKDSLIELDDSTELAKPLDTSESDLDDISVGEEGETSFTCEVRYAVDVYQSDRTSLACKNHLDQVVKDSIASKDPRIPSNPIVISPMTPTKLPEDTSASKVSEQTLHDKWTKGHIDNILKSTLVRDTEDRQPYPRPPRSEAHAWTNNLQHVQYSQLPTYHPHQLHPSTYVPQDRYHPYNLAGARPHLSMFPPSLKDLSPALKTGYEFLPHLNVPYRNALQSPKLPSPTTPKTPYSRDTIFNTSRFTEDPTQLSPTSPKSNDEHFMYSLGADGDSPKYVCPDCKKSYSTYSGLTKHKQFHCTAQAQKEFSCKHCNKTYTSLGALKMHIRTHTLPCKCHICGKAFSRPWLLQGHIRTHTGEKPFSCQHCNRAFADRSNLRAHLQTHTEMKKYSCKHCTKTFSRMSLLIKHEDGGCAGV